MHNGGGLVAAPGELLRLLGQLNKWPNPQKGPLIVPTVLQGLIPTVFFSLRYILVERGRVEFGEDAKAGFGTGPVKNTSALYSTEAALLSTQSFSKQQKPGPLSQLCHKYQTLLLLGNGKHSPGFGNQRVSSDKKKK